MIRAFVDPTPAGAGVDACRGRDLGFWLERAFSFCRFAPLPHPNREFDLALVFSSTRFPVLDAGDLRRRLGRLDARSDFFAPAGRPFFVVSSVFLRRRGIALRPGIFAALRSLPGVALLELTEPVAVLEPRRDPLALEAAVSALQADCLRRRGVRIENLGNFCLEGLPAIGRGTLLGSGIVVRGKCRIGRNVIIYPNCFIENSRIGDDCVILPGTVIRDSVVEKGVQLGPYCHLRNGSRVSRGARMGNFVEMKKSVLGSGSKAMHLSYIGDAVVGRKVNIGAGTITCNYDGSKKNPTRIGDNVFIGSGTELVAPITVHSDSYVGAGSTLTEDVPRHALAVARQRQKNIKGWVLRKRKK